MTDSLLPAPTVSDLEQLTAVRERLAVLEGNAWGTLSLTGADRAKFLHNFCTNEIKKLLPGQGCEAFCCNVKGRILAHAWIMCQPERLLVILERDRVEFLARHLERYLITEEVELTDLSHELSMLFVCGPDSTAAVQSIATTVPGESTLSNCLADVSGAEITVINWDIWNLPGWMLLGDRSALRPLTAQLLDSGAVVAGDQVQEYLRISAMIPRYGADISDEHLAQEANRTSQAISFVKGCYLGQEPIARLDALGHVNRELIGLRIRSETMIETGSKIVSTDDRMELGSVTSSAAIEGLSEAVALGIVKTKWTTDGTNVFIHAAEGTEIPATVFRAG